MTDKEEFRNENVIKKIQIPGVNPTKLFTLQNGHFPFFTIKLGHFIVIALFSYVTK